MIVFVTVSPTPFCLSGLRRQGQLLFAPKECTAKAGTQPRGRGPGRYSHRPKAATPPGQGHGSSLRKRLGNAERWDAARPSCARDPRPCGPALAPREKRNREDAGAKTYSGLGLQTPATTQPRANCATSLGVPLGHSPPRRPQKQIAELRKEEAGPSGAPGAQPGRKGRNGVRAEALAAPRHWPGRGGKQGLAAGGRGRSVPGAPPRPRPGPAPARCPTRAALAPSCGRAGPRSF